MHSAKEEKNLVDRLSKILLFSTRDTKTEYPVNMLK